MVLISLCQSVTKIVGTFKILFAFNSHFFFFFFFLVFEIVGQVQVKWGSFQHRWLAYWWEEGLWKYFSKWGKVGVLHFERKPQLKQTELTIGPIRLNTKFTVVLFSNEATETEVTIRESFTHHKTYMFKLLIQSSDT